MFTKLHSQISLLVLVGIVATVGFSADKEKEDQQYPFSVKLIDEDGMPVEGAKAGIYAFSGNIDAVRFLPTTDEGGWQYEFGTTTKADGVASFPDGRNRKFYCVVARQTARRLAGVWKIDSNALDSAQSAQLTAITMHPECRVFGRIGCDDLAKIRRDIGVTSVYLSCGGGWAFAYTSKDQAFHFFVPPGEYELKPYGSTLHDIEKTVVIKPGQHELDVGTIDVPASRLALLEGQPAPKLEGIECWKNGPAVQLENLRGKCVILDFWGYWCGPCVSDMPDLFKLHDKYHEQGLQIVGIHVDLGEDEEDPVNTVAKLDGKLSMVRTKLWGGRDIPYPVGLVTGKRASFGTGIETQPAFSELSAQYGVMRYPTLVLIDRRGNVVKRFAPHRANDIAILEKLLKDK